MLDEPEKKKKSGLRLVSRKSTKKMLGRWKKLESMDKSDTETPRGTESATPAHLRRMGVPLRDAISRDPSLDGLPLPAFFRTAIDYVEAYGLSLEGIYRVSSPKSRLDELERLVNEGQPIEFLDAHEAAGLVKRFIRQLPEPLLPADADRLAEQCDCDWRGLCHCGTTAQLRDFLSSSSKVDRASYHLVAYVSLHAQHVISHESENKMGIPALGLLLQTVMDMSRKLVCLLIQNASPLLSRSNEACYIFDNLRISPYILPRTPSEVESWQCEDKPLIEQELNKQNSLLELLHRQIHDSSLSTDASGLVRVTSSSAEGQLWGVQTAITALKRRLKAVAEPTPPSVNGSPSMVDDPRPCPEMFEEKQLLAVQSQLREDISDERRRIARLLWRLDEADENRRILLGEDDGRETSASSEDSLDEESWREQCLLEETARSSLVDEIGRLRTDCAVLRARIELYSHGQTVSTRF